MSTTQREGYLDLYRSKLHKELDQMQYGQRHSIKQSYNSGSRGWSAGIWAVVISTLVVAGISVTQLF